jgi:hypothetical protein
MHNHLPDWGTSIICPAGQTTSPARNVGGQRVTRSLPQAQAF